MWLNFKATPGLGEIKSKVIKFRVRPRVKVNVRVRIRAGLLL